VAVRIDGARHEHRSQAHLHRFTELQVALFGAGFCAFPIIAQQIYKFVAPGLYRNERDAFLPYLIATPVFFVLGALVVYFFAMPLLIEVPDRQAPLRDRRTVCHFGSADAA
jgi:hypothetical protein